MNPSENAPENLPSLPPQTSPVASRIADALLRRSEAEEARQKQWAESIKPTRYSGGLVRQLGAAPRTDRGVFPNASPGGQPVLGSQLPSGVAVDYMPRTNGARAEERAKRGLRIGYGAVFTVETRLDGVGSWPGSIWPSLTMRQREVLLTDYWDWPSSTKVFDDLHTKKFYYSNGDTTSYLFDHDMSDAGNIDIAAILNYPAADPNIDEPQYTKRATITVPAGHYSPMPESVVNTTPAYFYYVLYGTHTGFPSINAGVVPGPFPESFPIVLRSDKYIEEDSYDPGLEDYSQFGTNVTSSDGLEIFYIQAGVSIGQDVNEISVYVRKSEEISDVRWSVRLVRTYGHYLTLTKQGTVFAFWVNGYGNDPKAGIKYYVGTGPKPKKLELASSPPAWDWRGDLFRTPGLNFNQDYETTAYYADRYGSANFSRDKLAVGLQIDLEDEQYHGRRIQRMFGFNPDTQLLDPNVEPPKYRHQRFKLVSRDPNTGRWESTGGRFLGSLPVPILKIPFSMPVQDLCIPPVWITDRANYAWWQYPLFGAYYY